MGERDERTEHIFTTILNYIRRALLLGKGDEMSQQDEPRVVPLLIEAKEPLREFYATILAPAIQGRMMTLEEMKESLERGHEFYVAQTKRIQELEAELKEQCRINGIGAQRELKLETELNQARNEIEILRECLESIKEIEIALGGESALLADVNEALAKADEKAGR